MAVFEEFGQSFMTYPESKWRRTLFRAPIFLWRLGLGPIIGHNMLLLTTTGRKTGLPRRALTEYHTLQGKIYVPCAFGPQSDWYKNLVADPHVTVQTWQGAESMLATRVTEDEELLAIIDLMRSRNPVMLAWYFESLGIAEESEDILANKDRIYIIRFDPTTDPTPFPLEADLAWLWPVLLLAVLKLCRRRKK